MEHFDSFANLYKENYFFKKTGKNHEFNTRLEIVLELTKNCSGRLLDCACGSGEITAEVLASGQYKAAILVDISESMLALAEEKIGGIKLATDVYYVHSDVFDYKPDSQEKFDLILCLGLVAHTGELSLLLTQLKSMLSRNGKIILQSSLLDHVGIKFTKLLMSMVHRKHKAYDIEFYSAKDIEYSSQAAGLSIKTVMRYNFGIPFGDKVSKVANYWVEVLMRRFASKYGSDAVYVIINDVGNPSAAK